VTLGGVVLAAGAGTRLGRPKALVELGGQLLVDRSVAALRDGGCDPVVVVLGAGCSDIIAAAELRDAVVVVNDGWAEGIGSSLRTGLRAMTDLPAEAALVTLVDLPGVTPAVVRALAEHPGDVPAVVASYGGQPRNPVRLARAVWDDVCRDAVGDVGARAWLRAHPDQVVTVACDDLGTPTDIDTPEDLARATRSER
jgi:CTP:molybdopterin cytidylyltransferase MocA